MQGTNSLVVPELLALIKAHKAQYHCRIFLISSIAKVKLLGHRLRCRNEQGEYGLFGARRVLDLDTMRAERFDARIRHCHGGLQVIVRLSRP